MKKHFLLFALSFLYLCGYAQYPLQTVSALQHVSNPNLTNCVDSSFYKGDTVRVRGVVVMDAKVGSVDNAQIANGRNLWLQTNGGGLWSGIDIINFGAATAPTDMLTLVAGDSIEVTGVIDEFNGESEVLVLPTGNYVTLLGSGHSVVPYYTTINQLNDASRNNQLTTGEALEGAYVEFRNVTVSAVSYFSSNTRVSFDITDGSGGKINVSDRFLCQRMSNASPNPGTYTAPTVGDVIDTLRGIIIHSINNCPGTNGRGYEIHPFKASDIVFGAQAPTISNIQRTPITPTSSQTATITATVVANGGNTLTSVVLNYAVGVGTSTYTQVTMTNTSGSTWSGVIPAQANTSFVKYYLTATDNASLTSNVPAVPANNNPIFYIVDDNGTSIYDIQYTPYSDGNSGLRDLTVTVTGVVTATANDLGYVFIQQENKTAWAGIMCIGTGLSTVTQGQKITVTGTVKEDFGMTRLENISSVTQAGTGMIAPLQLKDTTFTTYNYTGNESYEGMLVTILPVSGPKLKVVDWNCDNSITPTTNFGEYRLGSDTLAPNTGTRVLAGRQSTSAFSSLNVSYVNDLIWQTTDGTMNATPYVVTTGLPFDSVSGIIYYSFSNLKLLPRNNSDFFGGPLARTSVIENANLNVYPNPAQNQVTLQWENNAGIDAYQIMDISGRVLISNVVDSTAGMEKISLDKLSSGLYLLSVQQGDARQVIRLQVTR